MAAPKTLIFVESPLSARFRFQARAFCNWLLALGTFATWALLVSGFWFCWIADAAGIAVLFYMVFFVLEKRAIKIRCHRCLRILRTNTPWVCGFRRCENHTADDFPFVFKCEHCGAEPKAYKCHHCGTLIYFTEDQLQTNYASCLNSPAEVKEEEIAHSDFEMNKRKLEYKLHLTRLTNDVVTAEKQGEAQKQRTPEQKVEDSWAKRRALTIKVGEIYKRSKEANAADFKDDPEMLQWANDALEDWKQSGEWERMI